MKSYATHLTKYKARVHLLNRHQIFLHASCIDEVVMVDLVDMSTLYISLKPHYDEAGEGGFSYRVSGTQEWQFQKTKEFLAGLRTHLGLPADLEATDAMRHHSVNTKRLSPRISLRATRPIVSGC